MSGPSRAELQELELTRSRRSYRPLPAYGSPEHVADELAAGRPALARVLSGGMDPDAIALAARASYHGGPGETVTSRTRAHTGDIDDWEDPTDEDQPPRGGRPHPRGLADIMRDNPELFGPSHGADGSEVIRPESPAQRAREAAARSRPGHTGAGGWH